MVKTGPDLSLEPKASFGFLTWVKGPKLLSHPLLFSQVSILVGSCVRSGVLGI